MLPSSVWSIHIYDGHAVSTRLGCLHARTGGMGHG